MSFGILFLHHTVDSVVLQNLESIKRQNPGATVATIGDGKTLPGGYSLAETPKLQALHSQNPSRSSDWLVCSWFVQRRETFNKMWICEWDAYCTASVAEFYRPVWDFPFVATSVVRQDREPNWYWFSQVPEMPDKYRNHAIGASPFLYLISEEALAATCKTLIGEPMVTGNGELRFATAAKRCGYAPCGYSPPGDQITWIPIDSVSPEKRAIWHPVKHLIGSSRPKEQPVTGRVCGEQFCDEHSNEEPWPRTVNISKPKRLGKSKKLIADPICYVCPTYGQYDYARAALESFFKFTPHGIALIIDDGHPGFRRFWDSNWNVFSHRFPNRRGLTRSWNYGLALAKEIGAKYVVCGNDDILFTPDWQMGPLQLLEDASVGVVGVLSNGPGWTNDKQNIWDHVPGYEPSDSSESLTAVAATLARRYRANEHIAVHAVNGFFMMSRTARWWEGNFDKAHVFNPGDQYAMTRNEEELQVRFRTKGWRSVVSLRSYIFHYRSVTRGDRYKQGMWRRRQTAGSV